MGNFFMVLLSADFIQNKGFQQFFFLKENSQGSNGSDPDQVDILSLYFLLDK